MGKFYRGAQLCRIVGGTFEDDNCIAEIRVPDDFQLSNRSVYVVEENAFTDFSSVFDRRKRGIREALAELEKDVPDLSEVVKILRIAL